MSETQIFRSAAGFWFIVVILCSEVLSVFALLIAFQAPPAVGVFTAIAIVVMASFPLWMLASTYYVVTKADLLIRSGPFRWQIARADIRDVYPSRSLLAAPALSLDRLEVCYGNSKRVLVSPRDQQGFIAALGMD